MISYNSIKTAGIGGLIALTALTFSCARDFYIKRLQQGYGSSANTVASEFTYQDKSCALIHRVFTHDRKNFMRILEIDSDANTRPRNMESYTPEELFTACNQVDNNPTNGDGDGVAVPEEIEATLKSLENRLPQ